MINQQFVLNCCQGYSFINREDDTGMEGLRKAKLSYSAGNFVDQVQCPSDRGRRLSARLPKAKQEQQETLQLQ